MATAAVRPRLDAGDLVAASDRTRRWTIVILVAVIAAGGWLRFASLGRLSFWADEFPHAIAGRALIHDGRPLLPSGRQYRRALAQTVLVAASMKAFGENERAARYPSALIGLATIPAVWLAMRRRFGEAAAIATAAALAVVPLHVAHSRSARFYAAFVLTYGATAVLASRAIDTRSVRTAILATVAFAVALHLQVLAVTVLLPLALQAVLTAVRAPPEDRRARTRPLIVVGGVLAAGAAIVFATPGLRHEAFRLLDNPIPGLRFSPGFHAQSLARPFDVVSHWAWVPLTPLIVLGLRRARPHSEILLLHLLAPIVLIATLFNSQRGVGSRYLVHLVPFIAALVGIGCAEAVRVVVSRVRPSDPRGAVAVAAAVLLAAASVAGIGSVWGMPSERHPSVVIPRPNWNAAGAEIRRDAQRGDGQLATSALAMSWASGRCGAWIRTREAAAPYMNGDRDIYCGTILIADAHAMTAYLATHPRGWVVADPRQWRTVVDPGVRAILLRISRPVDVGDDTIIVRRWG